MTWDSVKQEYNSLLSKNQTEPYIIPQGLRFLENVNQISDDYFVLPLCNDGTHHFKKITMYISKHGVFLLTKTSVEKLNTHIFDEATKNFLYGTILSGTVTYDTNHQIKMFIGYDLAFYQGIDMRKRSYKTRRKMLESVADLFPMVMVPTCTPINAMCDENYYEAILFVPNSAHYTNNRIFIYKKVENVGINFKIKLTSTYNYNSYILILKNNVFTGSPEFPYGPTIPLSKTDRNAIGDINDNIIEFRWESDGFIPYETNKDAVSGNLYAKMAWNYINNPIEECRVKYYISTFKKE